MRDGTGQPISFAMHVEDAAWRAAALSADYREGLQAFSEKRDPSWKNSPKQA
jgi:enoyl-CoA hydratase/carnithine racemase